MNEGKFIIGIDLGTTNCAVAYVDTAHNSSEKIEIFHPLQLVAKGTCSHQSLLPSYLYLPSQYEGLQENIHLPWNREIPYIVGEFAKQRGAYVPARCVSSAKSWLCHPGVDRKAAILPWGAGKDLEKISPVDASSRYLTHIREAWNYQMARDEPANRLENQEIILTVPASFDEVARELTLEAAQKAGLERITLLEEPQAAFYCWILSHQLNWHHHLHNGQIVLVCDIGGGTSDFSLITVQEEAGAPLFTRVAVGKHLILGGDNIDMSIARYVEVRVMGEPGKLDSSQWALLCHRCRRAKEKLLAEKGGQDTWTVIMQGRSSRLIGGTVIYELSRDEIVDIIEKGFFPCTQMGEEPFTSTRLGLQEWGLPYAEDTAVPRHLSSFLRKHSESIASGSQSIQSIKSIKPDALLFNGGALKPAFLQKRIVKVMEQWYPSLPSPLVLSNTMTDLAVAYGAAYYGLVRQGKGVRIRGGIGHSYYIGVEAGQVHKALCVVPRKMEEGEEIEIKGKEFILLIGQPVSFPLYTSTTRALDRAGDVLSVENESFESLLPVQTILHRGRAKLKEVHVHLRARLTEIGTIELVCVSREGNRQWRLQFGIRAEGLPEPDSSEISEQEEAVEEDPFDVERVRPLLQVVFGNSKEGLSVEYERTGPENLLRNMEKFLNTSRQSWPIFVLRKISEMLFECAHQRGQSAQHEARWLNLAGFCMRPGFGYALDEWRIKELWKIYPQGMKYPKDRETRVQWLILWRRVAGGLNQKRQMELYRKISPYLLPEKKVPRGPKPSSHELMEMWRLAVSLEQLPEESKEQMGAVLLDRLKKGNFTPADLWAIARLGARQPFYGSPHTVVRADVVEEWILQLLSLNNFSIDEMIFALTQLTRKTSDRARNVRDEARERVIGFLASTKTDTFAQKNSLEQALHNIREVSLYQSKERNLIFGESLPTGLHLTS